MYPGGLSPIIGSNSIGSKEWNSAGHSSSDRCFRNSELRQVFVLDHQQTKPSTSLAVRTLSTYSSSPDHPLKNKPHLFFTTFRVSVLRLGPLCDTP
ncbi:hypothetical protein DPEC_G00236950 [Dallia pectoralis]|uniref:Uncharacterized protein n=1 Tax=Dallia pectoralis TaxID=75939 RepID=A0ACC2FYN5_DALPE|nr:hypothetical protein DPEC_G00236950 [Dallia pectoralis]